MLLFEASTGTQQPFCLTRGCREYGEEGEAVVNPRQCEQIRLCHKHRQIDGCAAGWQHGCLSWAFVCWRLERAAGAHPTSLGPTQAPKSNRHWKLWFLLLFLISRWFDSPAAGEGDGYLHTLAPAKALVSQLAGKDGHLLGMSKSPGKWGTVTIKCPSIQQRLRCWSIKLDDHFIRNLSLYFGQLKTNINVKNRGRSNSPLPIIREAHWIKFSRSSHMLRCYAERNFRSWVKDSTYLFEKSRANSSGIFIWQELHALKHQYFTKNHILEFCKLITNRKGIITRD